MKQAIAAFLLCLSLVLGGVALAAHTLQEDAGQVAVTAISRQGDPAAAQGLVATQSCQYAQTAVDGPGIKFRKCLWIPAAVLVCSNDICHRHLYWVTLTMTIPCSQAFRKRRMNHSLRGAFPEPYVSSTTAFNPSMPNILDTTFS